MVAPYDRLHAHALDYKGMTVFLTDKKGTYNYMVAYGITLHMLQLFTPIPRAPTALLLKQTLHLIPVLT